MSAGEQLSDRTQGEQPMTELAEALADTSMLDSFEGKSVRRAGVEMPSAAGGLRKALRIEPRQMKQGETGHLLVEYVVQKIKHEPIDAEIPDGDQERIHVLNVTGVTFADDELSATLADRIAAQRERIERANERAHGIAHLPTPDEVAKLEAEHGDGMHAVLEANCPSCEDEHAAAVAEAGEPEPIAGRARRGKKDAEADG